MRLVSPFLKHAVYPALHRVGCLDRMMPPGGFAVANYHGVVPAGHPELAELDIFLNANLVRPEMFRRQLQFLKTHYRVIHPENYCAWIERGEPLPPRSVLVTCDDGLVNTLTDMLPVLQSENVPCLFFVTGASTGENPGMLWYEELYHLMRALPLDDKDSPLPAEEGAKSGPSDSFQGLWWRTVRRASRLDAAARGNWMDGIRSRREQSRSLHSETRWRLLNIADLRRLADAGMSIGAHTLTHPVLSLCSEQEAAREIGQSKTDLESALGRPVWAFAYPYGNSGTMGEREVRLARQAGFTCAFLNVERWGDGRSDRFAIPRIHVSRDTGLPEFAAHVCGIHTRLQRMMSR
jgi:peptidoglycan/xylan/chitin deacetylase (PgdA/CDA1 family)